MLMENVTNKPLDPSQKKEPDKLADAQRTLGSISNATQQFIADVLTVPPDRVYRMDDYDSIRDSLFDNVKSAVSRRFPLRNNKYSLGIEEIDYDDPAEIGADEEKRLLLENKSGARRLRGAWVLRDAATGKEISRTRRMTLMKVPRMTSRGTFIRNGREFAFGSIMRLEPGVYAKSRPDGVSAQFNIRQGTGHGFNMELNPDTGIFRFRRGTATAPAYTVLNDLGVSDDQMLEAWGKELFNKNKALGTGEKARLAANRIYSTRKAI